MKSNLSSLRLTFKDVEEEITKVDNRLQDEFTKVSSLLLSLLSLFLSSSLSLSVNIIRKLKDCDSRRESSSRSLLGIIITIIVIIIIITIIGKRL